MTTNKSIVFEVPEGLPQDSEALVTVWGTEDPPTIAFREGRGTWGPPIDAAHVEGEWPPSQETGAVLRAIDNVSVSSLVDGNPFAREAEALAGRFDDGSPNAGTLALVTALLAVAAELRAGRAS